MHKNSMKHHQSIKSATTSLQKEDTRKLTLKLQTGDRRSVSPTLLGKGSSLKRKDNASQESLRTPETVGGARTLR